MAKNNQKQISLRLPADLYDEFQNVCNDIGITTTSALIVYIKAVANRRKIPFELSAEVSKKIPINSKSIENNSNNAAPATQEPSKKSDDFFGDFMNQK